MSFERVFGKTAQSTVLENLIQRRGVITYISRIAEETGLSNCSVVRVLQPLVQAGIVTEVPFGKLIKTYTLNLENETTGLIVEFYDKLTSVN